MEVFAGFASHTDHEVGRLVDALTAMGQLDNTLIIYQVGDNGSSAEGGMIGMYNEMTYFNGVLETMDMQMAHYDELGGPECFNHFAAGWAVAGNTPFTWTKQVASNFGGTRNGLVMHWPNGIKAKGEVRDQFHHVIDIAPTVFEAAKVPAPRMVNGVEQRPIEGVSMAYSFDDAKAADKRKTQYFEIAGNRGIYHDGWFAGTVHKAPWEGAPRHVLTEDVWELYNVDDDFSMSNDLAAKNATKLKELQDLFTKEAIAHQVLPIDDRTIERFDAKVAGRPDLMDGRKSLTVFPGMVYIPENAFINVKNASVDITAVVEVGAKTSGVLLAQGGQFGGWSFWMKDNTPMYTYNFLGLQSFVITGTKTLTPGKHSVKMSLAYDGNSRERGKGATVTLSIDDAVAGTGRIKQTQPNTFSLDDTADTGTDTGTAVDKSYGEGEKNAFTGRIEKVTVEVK
jgi:arylsulfatase